MKGVSLGSRKVAFRCKETGAEIKGVDVLLQTERGNRHVFLPHIDEAKVGSKVKVSREHYSVICGGAYEIANVTRP